MRFTKMQGAGNDYVYIDCFAQTPPQDPAALARALADRHFGVGGDGMILILPSDRADARMRMFNADGSEGEMCGNGLRCVAKYVHDHGLCRRNPLRIETGAGVLEVQWHLDAAGRVGTVTVDMGAPRLEAAEIPTTLVPSGQVVDHPLEIAGQRLEVTCVSMGNPHCVCFVDSLSDDWVLRIGPRIEQDPRFPNRTNVEFVEVIDRQHVRQRTWERGSGETLACGTGASAVCVAGVLTGRTERTLHNQLLGGELTLRWDEASGQVFMTGPAEEVFEGVWPDASR